MLRQAALLGLVIRASLSLPVAAQEWRQRAPATNPAAYCSSMTYDRGRERAVMVEGPRNTWEWDGSDWRPAAGVDGSWDGVLTYDTVRGHVLYYDPWAAQTWKWDGVAWSRLAPATSPPPPPWGVYPQAVMTFDEVRGVAVLRLRCVFAPDFGTWEWDGVTWRQASLSSAWVTSIAYDRRRQVVVGTNFLWTYEWDGSAWNQRASADLPLSNIVYDGSLGEVIAMPSSSATPGVFAWNGSSWRLIPTDQAPAPGPCLAYDSRRGRIVYYTRSGAVSETWEFVAFPAAYSPFGVGCSGSNGKVPRLEQVGGNIPLIGSVFALRATDLPASGLCSMVLGLSKTDWFGIPLPLPLDFLAMPGCVNYTDHARIFPVVNAGGTAVWSFVVPHNAGLCFYNQLFAVDPGANGFGLIVSNPGEGVIGY